MSKFKMTKLGLIPGLLSGAFIPALAQDILPFPTEPSNSIAGISIAGSVYKPRVEKNHLPEGAPNIIVILVDDAGSGLPNTFGGEINTSTLTRLANRGISFNRFHTTAMSSPTRAALLTGRNHTRVENGQITEMAVNFDGFSGVIPKTSATIAEVLKNYGYNTAAFGKWHNTPALHTSKNGPFEYWPIGYGFEHFYGFLGGETSQYEPTLIENTTYIPCPKTPEEGYHLTEDIADRAIDWIKQQKALNPDKPFFLYWADSTRNNSFISASFSGLDLAKLLAWLKSSSRLYSSHTSFSGVHDPISGAVGCHGIRGPLVHANHPSWYIPRLDIISKNCVTF